MTEMFQAASRLKIRFDSPKGQLTIEDLWDIPLTSNTGKANCDDIARNLFRQLKSDDAVSFVETDRKSDPTIQLKFDIVKFVIDTRVVENKAEAVAKENREKRQRLMQIIADKENKNLLDSSLDDLRQMLATLS